MKRNLLTACFILFGATLFSCSQRSSQTEKDYIKNLEEKNKLLEKELNEQKSKPVPENETVKSKQDSKKNSAYFTIGSTEDEVLQVMGDPTTYKTFGSTRKLFFYGISSVSFENGRVDSYDNTEGNLKIKVRE